MKSNDSAYYSRFVVFYFLILVPSLSYLVLLGILLGNIFSFTVLLGLIVSLLISTKSVWNNYVITYKSETREINDISFWHRTPPQSIQEPMHTIANLGFGRLGEIDAEMPGFKKPVIAWIYNNDDGSIVGEVIPIGAAHISYL